MAQKFNNTTFPRILRRATSVPSKPGNTKPGAKCPASVPLPVINRARAIPPASSFAPIVSELETLEGAGATARAMTSGAGAGVLFIFGAVPLRASFFGAVAGTGVAGGAGGLAGRLIGTASARMRRFCAWYIRYARYCAAPKPTAKASRTASKAPREVRTLFGRPRFAADGRMPEPFGLARIKVASPIRISSPISTIVGLLTRWPFTNVPLVEPRSEIS